MQWNMTEGQHLQSSVSPFPWLDKLLFVRPECLKVQDLAKTVCRCRYFSVPVIFAPQFIDFPCLKTTVVETGGKELMSS